MCEFVQVRIPTSINELCVVSLLKKNQIFCVKAAKVIKPREREKNACDDNDNGNDIVEYHVNYIYISNVRQKKTRKKCVSLKCISIIYIYPAYGTEQNKIKRENNQIKSVEEPKSVVCSHSFAAVEPQ